MPSQLLQHPNELKLNIFEHLPAKDLQRLRRVCTQFHALVERNKVKFATSIRQRELSRLNDLVEFHDYGSVPFHVALGRWTRHRGIWLDTARQQDSMAEFVHHCFYGSVHPGFTFSNVTIEAHESLAEELCKIHVARMLEVVNERNAGGTLHPILEIPLSDMIRNNLLIDPRLMSIERTYMTKVIEAILALPELLGTKIHGESNIPSHQQKKLMALTPLTRKVGNFGKGICPDAVLVDLLGVPSLPEGRLFAYCVTDKKMLEVVKAALNPRIGSLDSLMEAGLLEELVVY